MVLENANNLMGGMSADANKLMENAKNLMGGMSGDANKLMEGMSADAKKAMEGLSADAKKAFQDAANCDSFSGDQKTLCENYKNGGIIPQV